MSDVTTVANLALGRLAIGKAVSAITDNTVEAKALNRIYDHCRQEVLRAFPWGFATRAEALAEVSAQTFPGWGYVYQYPSGCLNMRAVGDEGGIRGMASRWCDDPTHWSPSFQRRQPFLTAIKDDGASQVILTDVGDAWGFFTMDITNAGAWTADFSSVLAWRMAMEAGGPLQAKTDWVDRAEARYRSWLSWAAAASLNEAKDDAQADSASIACRY
jgi:hypothetical protein